jgi:hypothetical protein
MLSKFTASKVPLFAALAALLQCFRQQAQRGCSVARIGRLSTGLFNGAHAVEVVEIGAIVIVSVGLGLAGAGALLSVVFLCFTRPARLRTSAAS